MLFLQHIADQLRNVLVISIPPRLNRFEVKVFVPPVPQAVIQWLGTGFCGHDIQQQP